jgi:hypothetical protein
MKPILGILLILAGIASGIYFGVWWALIGGIVVVIEQVRAVNLDAMTVALGIVRILFAGFIGWASAMVLILPGYLLISKS